MLVSTTAAAAQHPDEHQNRTASAAALSATASSSNTAYIQFALVQLLFQQLGTFGYLQNHQHCCCAQRLRTPQQMPNHHHLH
jgi:recombinational DNA repair protein (RecF pathway)